MLWELRSGPLGFRALQAACDRMSPTVLATRLGELRTAGLVETDSAGTNHLTGLGVDLVGTLAPLNSYAARWGASLREADGKLRERAR